MILVLGTVCLTASLVLAITHALTAPVIARHHAAGEQHALQAVFPGADAFTPAVRNGARYFEARAHGALAGYCLIVNTRGYCSTVSMAVGITPDGTITGLQVLSQQETPGLGTRITEVRPGDREPWFTRQFRGRRGDQLRLHDIDAITGATITSRAVTEGLRHSIHAFLETLR